MVLVVDPIPSPNPKEALDWKVEEEEEEEEDKERVFFWEREEEVWKEEQEETTEAVRKICFIDPLTAIPRQASIAMFSNKKEKEEVLRTQKKKKKETRKKRQTKNTDSFLPPSHSKHNVRFYPLLLIQKHVSTPSF